MTISEKIAEWRKGCSNAPDDPAQCPDCTRALIDAIDRTVGGNAGPGDGRTIEGPVTLRKPAEFASGESGGEPVR